MRRNSLIAPLTEYGANTVGGGATARLADLLAYSGTAVNYGFLSGEPCHLTPDQLILRGLTLKGFWLAPKFGTMKPVEIRSHYDHLVQLFADGTLSVPVEATYTIDQARDAVSHAMREGRDGKILITAKRSIG